MTVPESADWIIDDARWERLYELTGGAAAICFQCGTCTASCPWGLVSEDTVSIRSLIRDGQLGLPVNVSHLWLCTTCSYCEAFCPRGVDISGVILGLRQMAWESRASPEGFPSLLWSIYWNNNPWSQPPSQRSNWAKDLDLPLYNPARHEILLYVGCTSSYDRRAQQIAKAIVLLLREAGVSFGVLKDDEPCCGEAALSIGHKEYYREVAEQAAKILHENEVDRLVTVSPHCFHALKNENPYLGNEVRVDHYTSFVADLIEAGRLSFQAGIQGTVTYHDPCYLARHNQEIEAPRRILASIPGLNVVEMKRSGKNTLCCGAGGGRMWLETEPGQRFADLRIHEAKQTGASILATACPFCLSCLEDSLKGLRMNDISVLDLAEIVALSIQEPVVQVDAADG